MSIKVKLLSPKTPWLAKKTFPSYVWDIPNQEKVIYLTFDDGPTPDITNKVVEILAAYQAKATFFCIGKNIAENPRLYRQLLDEGHAIGNHTYNHLKGWKFKTSTYLSDIQKTEELLDPARPKNSLKLFRPPYGKLKPSQGKSLQKLGYKIVMWDVLAIDWDASVSKEQVLQNIISNAESGSIVVLHDSKKAGDNMLYALPKALTYFSKKGYRFEKIKF